MSQKLLLKTNVDYTPYIQNIEEYNNESKENINDYLQSREASDIIKKYIKVTNVKPKNLYTEKTNFTKRYKQELQVLYTIIKKISLPIDIEKQIPELTEYYPFITGINKNISINIDDQISFIFAEVKNYFKQINPREYGEYYSSETLINTLLDNLTNDISINKRVIDPASGGGFFLFYYLKHLLEEFNPSVSEILVIKNNIFGNDIFPFSVIISKLLLGKLLEKYDISISKPYKFDNINIKNTLETLTCISSNHEKYDLIIGNPPYFRIDPHEENNICKCISYGHNYIHNLFIHWSIQHLNDDGELGFILPQSILSGFYYQKMRKEIINNLSIELIITGKEHEKSFSVQQDIMLFTALKKQKQSEYYKIGVINRSKLEKYSMNSKIFNNKLNVIPLFKNKSEYDNFIILSKKSIVVEFSKFIIGTGNFVWNQNKALCLTTNKQGSIPLINGTNVNINGIILTSTKKNSFSYCMPNKEKYIRNEKLILFRRMSPIGNEKRMIASIIDPDEERFRNGYVIENHVNFISCPVSYIDKLLVFITSKRFNDLLNSFCHTNQVSTNDLLTIFELLKGNNNE